MRAALILGATVMLSACSLFAPRPHSNAPRSAPGASEHPADGAAIAAIAGSLIGTPYHFGGADLAGFDCSGLAFYAYERVGISIPRTAAEQQQAAQPVPLTEISPGDLVFFRIGSSGVDHVGIYAGNGRFIHAPHAGVAVASADLSAGFYARHIVGAGRFRDGAQASP